MCFIYNECLANEHVINLGIVAFECWPLIFLSDHEYLFLLSKCVCFLYQYQYFRFSRISNCKKKMAFILYFGKDKNEAYLLELVSTFFYDNTSLKKCKNF